MRTEDMQPKRWLVISILAALALAFAGFPLMADINYHPEFTGSGGRLAIEDEDSAVTARDTLNFEGSGVACADDVDQTTCTIDLGAGSVDTFGSPVDDDIAMFTDADTVEGRSFAEHSTDMETALEAVLEVDQLQGDFDPDKLTGDATDDNLVDQDIMEGFAPSAAPALAFVDSDTTDKDDSVVIDVDCTATGTGAEECDATLSAQLAGAETAALAVDASENTVEVGSAGLGSQIHFHAGADALNDDDWSGIVLDGWNCGATIVQWDAVYLDDTTNEWAIADADLAGAFPARGVAVAACADGNPGVILVQGVVRNDTWAWAANGETLFLSDTGTGSSWTVTAPTTTGDAVQVIGFTINDDQAYFNFAGHYLEVQ